LRAKDVGFVSRRKRLFSRDTFKDFWKRGKAANTGNRLSASFFLSGASKNNHGFPTRHWPEHLIAAAGLGVFMMADDLSDS